MNHRQQEKMMYGAFATFWSVCTFVAAKTGHQKESQQFREYTLEWLDKARRT